MYAFDLISSTEELIRKRFTSSPSMQISFYLQPNVIAMPFASSLQSI